MKSQKERSLMYRAVREFFDSRGYSEIFTPTLSADLIPEPTIQNFSTLFTSPFLPSRELYLIPSPEIFMKQVMAEEKTSVYQISQCFRNSEQLGSVHNPEFTMLEYYTMGFSDKDSIRLTRELIDAVLFDYSPSFLRKDFIVLSVNEAMKKWAGCDLDRLQDRQALLEKARKLGQHPDDDEAWDDIFNRIFITYVEPSLPEDRIVVLTDYPYQIDCLAKKQDGSPYRSRWELYIAGIEVANCYEEETSPAVTAEYYRKEHERTVRERQGSGNVIPAVSESFPSLSIPPSSGVAIGLDRLLMCLTGKKDIREVLLFPMQDMIRS